MGSDVDPGGRVCDRCGACARRAAILNGPIHGATDGDASWLRVSSSNQKVSGSILVKDQLIRVFVKYKLSVPCLEEHIKPSVLEVVIAFVTTVVSTTQPSHDQRGGLKI
ncbi:hypothetical protein EVAR_981_1 [Eumeta japonica]|uniref:Uncharacterized protein n=1 Tax=Eumeta variegata TaxID=151549 RepID=A0A4C1SEC8_EUMVA|nr:hypothetical protein EVAR_981_1 [Eumeta japonica]